MRPAPFVLTLCSLAPLVLPTALSTSQVFHKLQISKPTTYGAPSLGVLERVAFSSSSELSANPLRKQVTSSLNSSGSSKSGSLIAVASLPDSEFLWEG